MLVGHASGHAIAFDNDSLELSLSEIEDFVVANGACRAFICVEVVFLFFCFGTRFEMKTTLS